MRMYFAHPVTDYGTVREAKAISALESYWRDKRGQRLEVENPNQSHHQAGYSAGGMEYFKGVVDACWSLAFMRFPNGAIGAGMGKEIGWALKRRMHVYELFDGRIYAVNDMPTPILTVDETRALISGIRAETVRNS